MSEAAGGGGRAEMERSIVQRSMEDEEFRQRLLDDTKAAVEQELGTQLPEDVEVSVVEESATDHLSGASLPVGGLQAGELSDQELEAGGRWQRAQRFGFQDCSMNMPDCGSGRTVHGAT